MIINHNPFLPTLVYQNDPEDFVMPYRLYGKVDAEVIGNKYMKLRKSSYGYIIRTGIADPRKW